MALIDPVGELDPRYSSPGAVATEWARARERFARAQVYWLSSVRRDGRPHVTPLLAVWLDGVVHFCTGPDEQKAANLAGAPLCALTTGSNTLDQGLDVVVEGRAVRITDDAALRRVAAGYELKYGPVWRYDVRDGAFVQHGVHLSDETKAGRALVYGVAPVTAYGFGKGDGFSQTRWRFRAGAAARVRAA